MVSLSKVELQIHVYQPSRNNAVEQFSANADDSDEDSSSIPAASVRELPSKDLQGVWDTSVRLISSVLS